MLSTRKNLAVTGCGVLLLTLLLGACSKASSAVASATGSTSAIASSNACSLLTQDEVSKATGNSVDFTKQESRGATKLCTFVSVSGSAVVLYVTSTPAAGLTGDIPGVGNEVSKYNLTQVSGIGDQAYAGSGAIVASKGSTAIVIVDGSLGGGNHQQALETMAKDVFAKV